MNSKISIGFVWNETKCLICKHKNIALKVDWTSGWLVDGVSHNKHLCGPHGTWVLKCFVAAWEGQIWGLLHIGNKGSSNISNMRKSWLCSVGNTGLSSIGNSGICNIGNTGISNVGKSWFSNIRNKGIYIIGNTGSPGAGLLRTFEYSREQRLPGSSINSHISGSKTFSKMTIWENTN